jgi:hypothetical protein
MVSECRRGVSMESKKKVPSEDEMRERTQKHGLRVPGTSTHHSFSSNQTENEGQPSLKNRNGVNPTHLVSEPNTCDFEVQW